jgi:hypothetical protein
VQSYSLFTFDRLILAVTINRSLDRRPLLFLQLRIGTATDLFKEDPRFVTL